MLKVTVGNSFVQEHTIIVPEDQVVKEALEAEEIAVNDDAPFQINGRKVTDNSVFNKTFAELGIQDGDFILGVKNQKNA